MQEHRAPIDQVHAAFTRTRAESRHTPTALLVRRVRSLEHTERDFFSPDFIRLCAYRHALADRGVTS